MRSRLSDPAASAHAGRTSPRTRERPQGLKRRDIQVLRGVAVLLVVLFHVGAPGLSGGFVGVDVFFVVSGFLVGGALAQEVASTGAIRVREFFARRARRIVPAAMVTIAVTAIAVAIANPTAARLWGMPWSEDSFAKDELSAILYVPNLWFMNQGREYGADSSGSPVLHFWSLGVEEQFYIVAPFVLLALWAIARGRRAVFAGALAGLGAASFVYAMAMPATDGNVGYFDPLARAWEMVAGVGAAMLLARGFAIRGRIAPWVAWIALVVIVGSAVLIVGEHGWPRWTAVVVVLATSIALMVVLDAPRALRPLEWLGDRSYSWYLWHWPFIAIAPLALGRDVGARGLVAMALVSLMVAHLSYRFIERPAMAWKVDTARARRAVFGRTAVAMLLAMFAVVGAAWIAQARVAPEWEGPVATPAGPFEALTPSVTASPSASSPPAVAAYERPDLDSPLLDFGWVLPSNLVPEIDEASRDYPDAFALGCHLTIKDRGKALPRCEIGAGPTTVAVMGDSHAAQWLPALEPWVAQGAVTLVPLTADGCAPVGTRADDVRPGCVEWRARAMSRLSEVAPDVIVFAAHYQGPEIGDEGVREIVGAFESFVATLPPGTKFYFVLDTPRHPEKLDRCAQDHPGDLRLCASSPAAVVSFSQARAIADGVLAAGGEFVDMTPYFCNSDTCGLVVGNAFIFRDRSHITATYARLLAAPFGAAIGLADA